MVFPWQKKNKIAVSVLTPIYNVERYLPQCVDSILARATTTSTYCSWTTARPTGAGPCATPTPRATAGCACCTPRTAASPRRATRASRTRKSRVRTVFAHRYVQLNESDLILRTGSSIPLS